MAIKSLDELRELRKSMQSSLDLRNKGEAKDDTIEILVGMGTCGIAAGARDTFHKLLEVTQEKGLDHVKVISVGCIGFCSKEPTVELHIPGRESLIYGDITTNRVEDLIDTVIVKESYLPENLLIKSFGKVDV